MSKKICVVTIVKDEIDIIPYTLPTVFNWADMAVVLDGGPEGSSTDGTREWLQQFSANSHRKIIFESGIYGTHDIQNNWDRVMRQRYLDILSELDSPPDWIFLVDADETYTQNDLNTIRNTIDTCIDDIALIRFPYINFFGDFDHYVTGGGWDVPAHHLSIYRPGFRYIDVSTHICDELCHRLVHYPQQQQLLLNNIHLYHYSHAQDENKERRRNWRYNKRGDLGQQVAQNIPDNPDEWKWIDPRTNEMTQSKVKLFTSQHPNHMIEYVKKYNRRLG